MFTPEEMALINRDAAQDGVLLQEGAGMAFPSHVPPPALQEASVDTATDGRKLTLGRDQWINSMRSEIS